MNQRLLEERDGELARRGFPEVMRTFQVAKALASRKKLIRQLAADGELESFIIRGQRRYMRLDVARFIIIQRGVK